MMRISFLLKNKHSFFLSAFIFFLLLVQNSIAQNSQMFTSSGSFKAPEGVTAVKVEVWGAGGGGSTITASGRRGGGGGGGAYASSIVTVTSGGNYQVTVGVGGVANSAGGNSSFNSGWVVGAGGKGGYSNSTAGGAGGAVSNSVGTIKYKGGNGSSGGTSYSGGGGGGAGSFGAGGDASGSTAGAGSSLNGGAGGAGVNGSTNGKIGNNYGGGGSGAVTNSGTDRKGGSGSDGLVVISWLEVSAETTETCVGGNTGTITVTTSGGNTPYLYRLNGGATQSGNLFTNLSAGSYTITVTDNIGRSSNISVGISSFSVSGDNQNIAASDSWIGHVYKRLDAVASPPSNIDAFSDYYGTIRENETFDESFGGTNNCFSVSASESDRAVYSNFFAVRFRMNSTRKGLYVVDLGSDDGSRLTVDGTLVYNNWAEQGFVSHQNVLFSLTGASSLVYDFYESSGGNQVAFEHVTRVFENTLSVNTSQNICQGSSGSEIRGDVFGPLPSGITTSGSGYQWAYSSSASGPWTNISGATSAEYTPSAASAPFNVPGTYYFIRKAILSSINNISPNPYLATSLSNVASITVIQTFPVSVSISASATAVCEGTEVIFTATPTNGGTSPNYQWYKGTNPISGATGSTYSSATLVDSDAIRVKMTSNIGCTTGNPAESNSIVLKVDAVSVGGTITSDQVVCYNSVPADIKLSGNTGNVVKWQKSSDAAFTSSIDIGVTTPTLAGAAIGPLTSKTYFRAVVKNGVCNPVFSSVMAVSIETTPPVFSGCLSDLTQNIDPGMCSALVSWTIPTVTDNCGSPVTITVSSSAGEKISLVGGKHQATIAAGTSVITYTAVDAAGNAATCSFKITVKDLTAPSVTSPPDQTIFCAGNIPEINTLAAFEAAGGSYSDNAGSQCNIVEVSCADVQLGSVVTRTYTIKDGGLNRATCQQKFTIISPPQVTLSSLGFDNTCPQDELTIHSDISGFNGAVHYQWQLKAYNSSSWSVVGGDNSTFTGVLANLGDEYRLLVSQTTDFNTAECSAISNLLRFVDVTNPVFTEYAPVSKTICTENGASSVSVTDIRLNHEDVADNCTASEDLDVSYTITKDGVLTQSGTNLKEGTSFGAGVWIIVYTVKDQSDNHKSHSFSITVNQSPDPISISSSVVNGGGTGVAPNQCGDYGYYVTGDVSAPAASYSYVWRVFAGDGTTGALLSAGTDYLIDYTTSPWHAASVKISWTGNLASGIYTIEVIKSGMDDCGSRATLQVTLQNNFNLFVNDPGHDCKGESLGAKSIDWQIGRTCGTNAYSFTYVIAAGEWNTLAEAQSHAVSGPETVTGEAENPRIIYQTVNYGNGGDFYTNQVFTLFIYNQKDTNNQSDTNATDDHQHFYLKGIPDTSVITTD